MALSPYSFLSSLEVSMFQLLYYLVSEALLQNLGSIKARQWSSIWDNGKPGKISAKTQDNSAGINLDLKNFENSMTSKT